MPLPAVAALLCTACGSVGTGTGPTGITIVYDGSDSGVQSFECASLQLSAIATFEGNGQVTYTDVTSRVTWRSSNPGVVDVGNGVLAAPGVVIMRTVGTAQIEADYAGLIDQIPVDAAELPALRIDPETLTMAPGSSATLRLLASVDPDLPEVDLTDSAAWRLTDNDAAADLVDISTIAARDGPVGVPLAVEARIDSCDRVARSEITLAPVAALDIHYEQPADTALPIGLGDLLTVEARFADGSPSQNLSDAVSATRLIGRDDETSLSASGDVLVLSGLSNGAVAQFELEYPPLDMTAITRIASFSDAEALSLQITPDTATLHYPDTLQLDAVALFNDGISRPARRLANWSTEDADLVSVVASGVDAGEVEGTGLKGTATIEATLLTTVDTLIARREVNVD